MAEKFRPFFFSREGGGGGGHFLDFNDESSPFYAHIIQIFYSNDGKCISFSSLFFPGAVLVIFELDFRLFLPTGF